MWLAEMFQFPFPNHVTNKTFYLALLLLCKLFSATPFLLPLTYICTLISLPSTPFFSIFVLSEKWQKDGEKKKENSNLFSKPHQCKTLFPSLPF
jgi:hypothetical protein